MLIYLFLLVLTSTAFGSFVDEMTKGNERFISEKHRKPLTASKTTSQQHQAVILTSSDTPYSPESVFAMAPEKLYVLQTLGPELSPATLGSIELAFKQSRFIDTLIVLGHSGSKSTRAALEGKLNQNSETLIKAVRAAAGQLQMNIPPQKGAIGDDQIDQVTRRYIQNMTSELKKWENFSKRGRAKVLGAMLDSGTGKVEWLE